MMIHNLSIRTIKYKLIFAAVLQIGLITGISAQKNYASLVNPFVGTGGHGHTFPGAVLPFGMVQLSPDTRVDGSWDGCSGYHHSDTLLYGFSHTHLSGTGCSDWGDILLMPTPGQPVFENKAYASPFSHSTEKASPGFYEVQLNKGNIKAELTVTPRVGIHRYTFSKEGEYGMVVDLSHRDKTLDASLRIRDSVTVVGYRVSEAWAKKQHIYFVIRFSKAVKFFKSISNKNSTPDINFVGDSRGMCFTYNAKQGESLIVKVGISSVSMQGALNNLEAEAKHWNFDEYKKEAENTWNKQLSKIEVESNDVEKQKVFYTSLYHVCIHPSLNMDVDNQYRGRDEQIHTAEGFTNYSVFSLWDTYRALHPLLSIIDRKRTADFVNSFLVQYKQAGRLPVWELSSNETDCMIGFHSVSVIADAMVKGIRGFDTLAVYNAMKAASNYTRFGIPEFNKQGYLQVDNESESVSKTLEYAYDNWCIAQVAALMKESADEKMFLKRSLAYQHLFDVTSGNMRPRKNGGWLSPFYPNEINNHFTEGNSWQYSFYVPHDIEGLVKLHGGVTKFENKLDELFNTTQKTRGRDQADVTGLIGQYAHGNEPSHHMAFLYNYTGKPQKTINRVRWICDNFYKNSPDGLIGNEDCGQMSAWYVLSSMGLYAVCPGSTQYVLSEPVFNKIKINLENGKAFSINANPALNKAVTGVELNGIKNNRSFINYTDILNGSTLTFLNEDLKDNLNVYGLAKSDWPSSSVNKVTVIPAPIITTGKNIFKDTTHVSLSMINLPVQLICVYNLNRNEPDALSTVYAKTLLLDSSVVIKARVFSNEDKSPVTEARIYKLKNDYQPEIKAKLNEQYMADGPQTLVDGLRGDVHWRKGSWLGCQGQDFVCVMDLKKPKKFSELMLGCLQDTPSWIVFPSLVTFYGSNDNQRFVPLGKVPCMAKAQDDESKLLDFKLTLKQAATYRYVKVVAKNFGKLPAWHPGSGGEAFIFTDEFEVK